MADQWHLLTGVLKHGKIRHSYLLTTVSHTCSSVLWDLYLPSKAVSLGSSHTRGPHSSGRPGQGTRGLEERMLYRLSCRCKALQPPYIKGPSLIISQRSQRASAVAFGTLQSGFSHHPWHHPPWWVAPGVTKIRQITSHNRLPVCAAVSTLRGTCLWPHWQRGPCCIRESCPHSLWSLIKEGEKSHASCTCQWRRPFVANVGVGTAQYSQKDSGANCPCPITACPCGPGFCNRLLCWAGDLSWMMPVLAVGAAPRVLLSSWCAGASWTCTRTCMLQRLRGHTAECLLQTIGM